MAIQDVKQEIKDAVDIVEVISTYTPLSPSGNKWKGLSPFTTEKTPSFYVDPDKGLYFCFSTSQGGDVFTFLEKMENISFREALEQLSEKTGIPLGNKYETKDIHKELYSALEKSAHTYQSNLTKEVQIYLQSRGFTNGTIKTWCVGYAKKGWNTLCQKGMKDIDSYIESGICVEKETEEKKSIYDRFRSRIMFPFLDEKGRVIGFSGRVFGEEEGAKYINSPETPLFQKSKFLFGLHIAKTYIRKNNVAIIAEGPLDAMAIYQAGYPCTIATSGTAITIEHLQILRKYTNRIILALDGDSAGVNATIRVIPMALSVGLDIKIAIFPEGCDPGDLLKKDASQIVISIKQARTVLTFLNEYIEKKYGTKKEDVIRGVREEILPIVSQIKDPLLLDVAIKELQEKTGLSQDSIEESMKSIKISGLAGKTIKKITHTPKVTPEIKKKDMSKQLTFITNAMAFLEKEDKKVLTKDIQESFLLIKNVMSLPKPEVEIFCLEYETRYEDKEERTERVLEGLKDMLQRVLIEIKREDELKKYET